MCQAPRPQREGRGCGDITQTSCSEETKMTRRLLSALFLLTAITVALGAFGHGAQWSLNVAPALKGARPELMRLLELVWYWVSGAMLTFGALLVWSWWRMGRGATTPAFVPWMIGAFYL